MVIRTHYLLLAAMSNIGVAPITYNIRYHQEHLSSLVQNYERKSKYENVD
jgi:hypothetical protein